MRSVKGFTLIEVMLVTALTAVTGLAVYNCLSNGLKLWAKVRDLGISEEASLFLDRFSVDVRNSFVFSSIPVEGKEQSFAFPTQIYARTDPAGSRAAEITGWQLGRVRYFYDPGTATVNREQADYGQATSGVAGVAGVAGAAGKFAPGVIVVNGVTRLRFRYYYVGEKEPVDALKRGGVFPSAVEIELGLGSGSAGSAGSAGERLLTRFITIPSGA